MCSNRFVLYHNTYVQYELVIVYWARCISYHILIIPDIMNEFIVQDTFFLSYTK